MEKTLEVLELKSTLRGLIGSVAAKAFWLGVSLVAGFFVLDWARSVMARYEAAVQAGREIFISSMKMDAYMVYFLTGILFLVAFLFFCCIVADFYKAWEVNRVFLREGRIVSTAYAFPFQKVIREIHFNRILRTEVSQGNFDRLYGTGTLELALITYINADSRRTNWDIPYITDPISTQAAILAAMPTYTGLEVKVAKD